MSPSAGLPGDARFTYSDHLVRLLEEAARDVAVLTLAPPERLSEETQSARRHAARWSARLDGSPLEEETARRIDTSGSPPVPAISADAVVAQGGWARALKLGGVVTQDVAAVEYHNLLTAWDAEPALAEEVLEAPMSVLTRLHGLICAELIDGDAIGRPRRTAQAVHDGAEGKMLYAAVEPDRVPGLLAELVDWVGAASAPLPDLVLAGIAHERLLQWQPFDAGNGRTTRAFTRVLLRARGLDPDGLALPEQVWAADPLGYYGEVAATIRRRQDLTRWLERYAEAIAEGLALVSERVSPRPAGTPSPQDEAVLAAVDALGTDRPFTLTELAAQAGVGRDVALTVLRSGLARRLVRAEPGSQGLRYRRRGV